MTIKIEAAVRSSPDFWEWKARLCSSSSCVYANVQWKEFCGVGGRHANGRREVAAVVPVVVVVMVMVFVVSVRACFFKDDRGPATCVWRLIRSTLGLSFIKIPLTQKKLSYFDRKASKCAFLKIKTCQIAVAWKCFWGLRQRFERKWLRRFLTSWQLTLNCQQPPICTYCNYLDQSAIRTVITYKTGGRGRNSPKALPNKWLTVSG